MEGALTRLVREPPPTEQFRGSLEAAQTNDTLVPSIGSGPRRVMWQVQSERAHAAL